MWYKAYHDVDNRVSILIYRAHTSIDDFTNSDVDKVLDIINLENKSIYMMGDFNIDLLKDDCDRPTHDFIDLIIFTFSYSNIL